MDEVTKERIFIIAAIANILLLFAAVVPYFVKYSPYLELIPTNYRIYLFVFLLLVLVFIILKLLSLRARKYPVSIKSDNILYTIENPTGKLVHCEKNQLMRANSDFIKIYDEEIIVDGRIENVTGTIEGGESTIIVAPKREGMTWNVQHVFHRQLPKNKYIKRTFSFHFIDSFTENNEYILCRIVNIVDDFQLSVIFPADRPPQEVRGFLKRGAVEVERLKPPIHKYELFDRRVRVDWQVKRPRTGDIYRIIWSW